MTRRAFEHLKSSCDAEDLLRRAGLTLKGIEDPQARIGAESQIAFLKLASEALDDPLLGFHLAESFEPRELGLLYYVQASSATLGEALGRVARYSSVAHEGLAAKSVRGNALTFRIDYVGVPRHTDRHQMEFLITGLVRIFRKLTNTHLRPIRVWLAHPRCAASAALEKFLGQSIEFGAGHDEMTFVGAAADLPVVSADPYLNEALVRYWEDALDRRGSAQRPLRAAVENAILLLLPMARRGLAGSRRRCISAPAPWRAGLPPRTSLSRRCSTSFAPTSPSAISTTPRSRFRTLPGSSTSRGERLHACVQALDRRSAFAAAEGRADAARRAWGSVLTGAFATGVPAISLEEGEVIMDRPENGVACDTDTDGGCRKE